MENLTALHVEKGFQYFFCGEHGIVEGDPQFVKHDHVIFPFPVPGVKVYVFSLFRDSTLDFYQPLLDISCLHAKIDAYFEHLAPVSLEGKGITFVVDLLQGFFCRAI